MYGLIPILAAWLAATRSLRSGAREASALRSGDSASRLTEKNPQSSRIQASIEQQRKRIETTTKAHPTYIESASNFVPVQDDGGRWMTVDDNDDHASGVERLFPSCNSYNERMPSRLAPIPPPKGQHL